MTPKLVYSLLLLNAVTCSGPASGKATAWSMPRQEMSLEILCFASPMANLCNRRAVCCAGQSQKDAVSLGPKRLARIACESELKGIA